MSGPAVLGLDGRVAFTITVPETWYEIDLHPATRDRSIRELVETRVRGNDAMWQQRRGIIKLLSEYSAHAWNVGALYCAAFALPTEDGPVTGSVVVTLVRGPAGASDEPDRTDHLLRLFRSKPRATSHGGGSDGGRDGGSDSDAGDFDEFAMTSHVEIETCGGCARSWGVADVQIGDSSPEVVRHVFMQTAIPIPEFNKVLLVSASSPVVVLRDVLHDLFDAVTGTLRLVELPKNDLTSAT